MSEIAFLGDIHGEHQQLEQVIALVLPRTKHLVFLGDYVNRGPDSREVLDSLIRLQDDKRLAVTFLEGNHDRALRQALTEDGMRSFLRTGGAPTVRSYIGAFPEPDVSTQLRAAVPETHVAFLSSLRPEVVVDGVHAAHHPPMRGVPLPAGSIYGIYGHVPQADTTPTLTPRAAYIDTGCGTLADGKLTALFWPSLTWVQSSPRTTSILR